MSFLLLPGTRGEWKAGDWQQQVRVILGHAVSSDNSKTQRLAIEVVHCLSAQGADFRDVLEQTVPTSTSESV